MIPEPIYKEFVEKFSDKTHIQPSKEDLNASVDKILNECYDELIASLNMVRSEYHSNRIKPEDRYVNLFESAGAENLFLSNKYTRVISEKLGHKFEDIASLSVKAFNHEEELGIMLRGIDVIIYDGTNIRYTQLKTKCDTLTGSQVPRSNRELAIHQHSIFAAALNLGGRWTFGNRTDNLNPVTRLAGSQFWNLIGMDYNHILRRCKELILRLEEELY